MSTRRTVLTAALAVALLVPAIAAAQEISVSPPSVMRGAEIEIVGSCGVDGGGQTIQIVLGGGIEGGQLARVEPDPISGEFSTIVTIPQDSPIGSGTVAAACGLGADENPSAALTITASDAEADQAPDTTVAPGDTSQLVAFWQDRLNEWIALSGSELSSLAVDGIFGPNTESATLAFQRSIEGLEADGIVNPADRVALREAIERLEADESQDTTVAPGDTSQLVAFWQDRLNEWIALSGSELSSLAVDGIFGPNTESATLAFQRSIEGLEADGIVNPADRVALREAIERLEAGDGASEGSPVGDFSADPFETDVFPGRGEPALLSGIDVGSHEGFTRVVFEFTEAANLSYRVRYVEETVGPSGEPVAIAGQSLLEVSMSPAAGVDLSGEDPDETYTGPARFEPADERIAEMVLVEDFEGFLTWAIGTTGEEPFATTILRAPTRLVVDIASS